MKEETISLKLKDKKLFITVRTVRKNNNTNQRNWNDWYVRIETRYYNTSSTQFMELVLNEYNIKCINDFIKSIHYNNNIDNNIDENIENIENNTDKKGV